MPSGVPRIFFAAPAHTQMIVRFLFVCSIHYFQSTTFAAAVQPVAIRVKIQSASFQDALLV
jgi:uncharacterized membrane protein